MLTDAPSVYPTSVLTVLLVLLTPQRLRLASLEIPVPQYAIHALPDALHVQLMVLAPIVNLGFTHPELTAIPATLGVPPALTLAIVLLARHHIILAPMEHVQTVLALIFVLEQPVKLVVEAV